MTGEVDLFEQTIELPRASPTNWALLSEIFDLFRPYADTGRLEVEAKDSRGRIKRGSVDAIRAAVESRGEDPTEIRFDVFGTRETYLHLMVWRSQAAFGRVLSLDGAPVDEVIKRLPEIFAHYTQPGEERATIFTATLPPVTSPPAQAAVSPVCTRQWREFFRHAGEPPRWERWLFGLVGAAVVIGAAILTIIYA